MSNNGDKKVLLRKKATLDNNLSTNHNYFYSNNKLTNSSSIAKHNFSNLNLNQNTTSNAQSLVYSNNNNNNTGKLTADKKNLLSISTLAVTSKINNVVDSSNFETEFLNNKNANDDTTIEEIMKSRRKVESWLQQNHEYFLHKTGYDE